MKKIIVSGLSGLIGSRFQTLYDKKYDMANLDLTNGVDITDFDAVDAFLKAQKNAEAVIHLAAFTNVSAAHEQNGDREGVAYKVNVLGTENLVKVVEKYGIYLVHISTDFVFDGEKDGIYTEEDEPNPIEWYGQTKLWAEEKVRQFAENWIILRIAYPYQANPIRPDFIANLISKLTNNSLPPAFTDHWVTPTFVDDLCDVFDYCIDTRPNGLYHSMGSSWHTDHEMARLVKSTFDLPGKIAAGDLEAYLETINRPYQRSLKVSNKKLTKELGVAMSTFIEGLDKIKKQLSKQ